MQPKAERGERSAAVAKEVGSQKEDEAIEHEPYHYPFRVYAPPRR